MTRLVVLDRDGVINEDSHYVRSADEWIPIPGSLEAIARLKEAAFCVAVVSNQSGIARGFFDERALIEMHEKMHALLAKHSDQRIDRILYCPHAPDEHCKCRKPATGMLDQLAAETNQNLAGVWIIGDSLRDLQAGVQRRMQPVLVRTGKGAATEAEQELPPGTRVFDNLYAAVQELLRETDRDARRL